MNWKTSHHLYPEIDRSLAESNYVIVDPLNPNGLVYLTPSDYNEASRTWLRTGTKVTVLHSPFSKKDAETLKSFDLNGPSSDNKSKPLKGINRILSKRTVLMNMLAGSWNDTKMISLTNSNGLGLLKFYLRMVVPLSLAKALKDVSGKMWLTSRFISYLIRLHKIHGASYVVTYLKLNQLAISRAIGRQPLGSLMELDTSYIHRRLSRSGLPRFIPVGDRSRIMSGSSRTIRFWLTLYGMYRILQSPAVPKLSTITAPLEATEEILSSLDAFFVSRSKQLLERFHHWSLQDLVVQKWDNLLTSSSISVTSWKSLFSGTMFLKYKFPNVYSAIREYISLTQTKVSFDRGSPISVLIRFNEVIDSLSRLVGYSYSGKKIFSNTLKMLDFTLRSDASAGRLACKIEPAGKVRVFAMVDILTQNILKPFHLILSKILKALPNDGTFDQEAMVNRAADKATLYKAAYCYDLSAATDRLPIIIQVSIVKSLLGQRIAELWKTILVDRPYLLPDNKTTQFIFKDQPEYLGKELFYSTGQPMGALSSFNMLGITHHMIVQYCASLVFDNRSDPLYFVKGWCICYEILGDDIAIFHEGLAHKYLEVMSQLGVAINVKKSVIDTKGKTLELAKRTIHHGIDVSAISFKDILSSAPFAQRAAIVERVTRRGTVKTQLAIQILSQFYGENPELRRSYMLISLFFKGYNDKKVSLTDVYFFLFLIRKFSSGNLGSSMSFSQELVDILYTVVNKIYYKGLTSYNANNLTLFSRDLWNTYCVEFFCTMLCLVPIFRTETLNRVKEYAEVANQLQLVKSDTNELMSLDRTYVGILLGYEFESTQEFRKAANELVLHVNTMLQPDIFLKLSGSHNIRTLKLFTMVLKSPLASPYKGLVPGQNPLDFLFLSEPRECSITDLHSINVSSIGDLIFLNEEIDSLEHSKITMIGKELTDPAFSPLSEFSENYNYLSVVNDFLHMVHDEGGLVPTVEMTYGDITLAYYEIWALSEITGLLYEPDNWNALVTKLFYDDNGVLKSRYEILT
jgi:hypothetical protein